MRPLLVWSFANLANMDRAIDAIREARPSDPVTAVKGCIDGNVYWSGDARFQDYVTGICRGVAFVTRDGSIPS